MVFAVLTAGWAQLSEFRVPVTHDLGDLRRLEVGHSGFGRTQVWLLERIEITKTTLKVEGGEGVRDHKTFRFNNIGKEWIGHGFRNELTLHPAPQVRCPRSLSPEPKTRNPNLTPPGSLLRGGWWRRWKRRVLVVMRAGRWRAGEDGEQGDDASARHDAI